MPLNASEKTEIATTFLRCFGESYEYCGRTLKFLSTYTAGKVNLLAEVSNLALNWQPFIDAGMDLASRQWWVSELTRIYNSTDTSGA